jgi:nucleotide-binding universal stress UspA family protein
MAAKTYLVPVDFSKGSEAALDAAVRLAKEHRGKLLLVHVISLAFVFPMEGGGEEIFATLEKNARDSMRKLVKRRRFKPGQYRSMLLEGIDPAQAIAVQAKKSRAAMIVMGSHGNTGMRRLLLGSTAERTLRYAHCPVLIVKK